MRVVAGRVGLLLAVLVAWELATRGRDPVLYVGPSQVLPALASILRLGPYPTMGPECRATGLDGSAAEDSARHNALDHSARPRQRRAGPVCLQATRHE